MASAPRDAATADIVGFAGAARRAPDPAPAIVGGIDGLIGTTVFGWAYDSAHPGRRVGIAVYVGERLVGETVANGLRRERVGVSQHDGYCGFACQIPPQEFVAGGAIRIFAERAELTEAPLLLGPEWLDGFFEPIVRGVARGWARERVREPARARLDLVIDGRRSHSLIADVLRDELSAQGVGDGRFGFAEALPSLCFDGEEHRIELRHSRTGVSLAPGPRPFRASFAGAVERLDHNGGAGWVFCREAPDRPVTLDIRINGERIRTVADLPRTDIRGLHGVERCGFEFAIPAALPRDAEITVDLFVAGTANPAIAGPFRFTPLARVIAQLEGLAAAERRDSGPQSPLGSTIVPALVASLRAGYQGARLNLDLDLALFRGPDAAVDTVVDVVIPVYRGLDETVACIRSVIGSVNATRSQIVVVNDASPDPLLAAALAEFARNGAITLVTLAENGGFPAAANAGIALHPDRDVILLNADTLVPDGWIDRLRAAACRTDATGSATPFSNRATICSYPRINQDNDLPDDLDWAELDRLCARANEGLTVDIPTAVGFCAYLKRAMLREVGPLNAERWGRGYGEENELCILAAARGWKHVLAADLFVVHHGAVSFGPGQRAELLTANLGTLNTLYPDYFPRIMAFLRDDPPAAARRAVDWARLARLGGRFMLLVTHRLGGGTAIHVDAMAQQLERQGHEVLVLEANSDAEGRVWLRNHRLGTASVYALPGEFDALVTDLRHCGVWHIHFHQIMGGAGWASLPQRLGCHYDVTVHDYSPFCPRVDLIDENRRYCGEPPASVCERCIALNLPAPEWQRSYRSLGGLGEWLQFHAGFLSGARRVFVPSLDAKERIARRFPNARYEVKPHPEATQVVTIRRPDPGTTARVAVIGAIGANKGYDLLLGCAQDALKRELPLEFRLFGYTADDTPFRRLANVRMTGEYAHAALPRLLQEHPCDIALFLSIWPETYCYALSDAYGAGLYPVALAFGALRERIEATGVGSLISPASTPAEINTAILREVERAGQWPGTIAFGSSFEDLLGDYYDLAI